MNNTRNTIGSRIKHIRELLELTGEEFGKKLNVTKVAVSNWENNNRKPDVDMLVKIAQLGDVTTDYLLGRIDDTESVLKLNDKIKNERLKLDINQVELSKMMNVSKQTVSNWENANRTPDVITLSHLADIFNCSVDYLLGRVDDMDSILCAHEIDGEEVIVEVSKEVYPNGITKEELIEKLKIIKQLEEMGMSFPTIPTK